MRRNPGADGLLFLGDGLRDTEEVRTMFAGRTWEAVKGNCDGFFLPEIPASARNFFLPSVNIIY